MKVRNLIKLLQKFDQDLEVVAGQTIFVPAGPTEKTFLGATLVDPTALAPVVTAQQFGVFHPEHKEFVGIGFDEAIPLNQIPKTLAELNDDPEPDENDAVH